MSVGLYPSHPSSYDMLTPSKWYIGEPSVAVEDGSKIRKSVSTCSPRVSNADIGEVGRYGMNVWETELYNCLSPETEELAL